MESRKDDDLNQNLLSNDYNQNNYTIKIPSHSVEHLYPKVKNQQNSLNSKHSIHSIPNNIPQNQYQNIFSDQFGMNNSFISVILHLCYRIFPIYNYYMKKISRESDKFSIHLHNIFVNCNNNYENKILDINKLKTSLFKINSNFQINEINDPINLFNLIIENANLKNFFSFQNVKIKDVCDCGCSISYEIDKFQNIFDIPLLDIIKLSENHSSSIYYNKGRLISFYKSLIEHNFSKKINCPLNSVDCNYNRITRNFFINPDENNNSKMNFILFDYILSNRQNLSMMNLLLSYILIPMSFDIEDLLNFIEGKNIYENTENNFEKYIFKGCIFKTNSKSYTCVFKSKTKWIYYDDNENILTFSKWYKVIQYCLKNNLFPYILYYVLSTENSNENITKDEYNILENFAIKYDEFKEIPSMRIKLYEYVNSKMREDTDNIKFEENEDTSVSRHSKPKNPYKRDKRNNSYSKDLSNNSSKNQQNLNYNYPLQLTEEQQNYYKNNTNKNYNHYNDEYNQTLKKCKSTNLHHKKGNYNNFPLNGKNIEENTLKLYKGEDNKNANDIKFNDNKNIKCENIKLQQKWICPNCSSKIYESKCKNCDLIYNNLNQDLKQNTNLKNPKREERKLNNSEKREFINTNEDTFAKKKNIYSKVENTNIRSVFKRIGVESNDSKNNKDNNNMTDLENSKYKSKKYINIPNYKKNNNYTEPGIKPDIINPNKSINNVTVESVRNSIPNKYSKNSYRSNGSYRNKNDDKDNNNYTIIPNRKNSLINNEKSSDRNGYKQNINNTLKYTKKKV